MELFDIFTLFGCPKILHSDNGREFVNQIIVELKEIWPGLALVCGKPRHPQTQGSVERANGDMQNMLGAWMRDNHSDRWTHGLKFAQLQKNTAYNRGVGMSPFELLFGEPCRIGLKDTPGLPPGVASTLTTEEELDSVLEGAASVPSTATSTPTGSMAPDLNLSTTGIEVPDDHEDSLLDFAQHEVVATCSNKQMKFNIVEKVVPTCSNMLLKFDRPPRSDAAVHDDGVFDDGLEDIDVAKRMDNIKKNRNQGLKSQKKQADYMLGASRKRMKTNTIEIGTNIAIPIPVFDRAKLDAQNVIGVVSSIEDQALGAINIWTQHGALDGVYFPNQYTVLPERHLHIKDVMANPKLSLRKIASLQSISGGQGISRCTCTSHSKCQTKNCGCFRQAGSAIRIATIPYLAKTNKRRKNYL